MAEAIRDGETESDGEAFLHRCAVRAARANSEAIVQVIGDVREAVLFEDQDDELLDLCELAKQIRNKAEQIIQARGYG